MTNNRITALLFPGQGSQIIGMGKDFYNNFNIAKDCFLEADDVLNFKLSDIIFNGPENELSQTENTQAALLVTSMAIFRVITDHASKSLKDICSYVIGHSLGEYTALAASKVINFRDAVKLVRLRGKSMQEAVPLGKGGMAAILGADIEFINDLISKSKNYGICQIANDNCPGQIVISGEMAAINFAIEYASNNSKKSIKLPVSAPFHSTLMDPVKEIMLEALTLTNFSTPEVPIICNVTAREEVDPNKLRNLLVEQISGNVRFNESISYLFNKKGIKNFIEIGSGKVLTGLVKRICLSSEINLININNINAL